MNQRDLARVKRTLKEARAALAPQPLDFCPSLEDYENEEEWVREGCRWLGRHPEVHTDLLKMLASD